MSKQNKKKIGYKQYEHLISLAHNKIEKFNELIVLFSMKRPPVTTSLVMGFFVSFISVVN